MTRDEFLQELRIALQGRLPQAQVNEHLNYYENYIIEESRKGRTQEEVIASLGNPRLIAKTLINTFGGGIGLAKDASGEGEEAGGRRRFHFGQFRFPNWIRKLLTMFAIVVFLILLLRIGILLLPILITFIMIVSIFFGIVRIFFPNKK